MAYNGNGQLFLVETRWQGSTRDRDYAATASNRLCVSTVTSMGIHEVLGWTPIRRYFIPCSQSWYGMCLWQLG